MAKTGRNEPCPCGSGKKYKHCHESKTSEKRSSRVLMIVVGGAVLAAIAVGVVSFSRDGRSTGTRVWDPVHGHYHDANGVQVP
jgi:hypothetical protein